MSNLTISIFRNQIFSTIVNESKALSEYKFSHPNDFTSCVNEAKKNNQLIVFFKTEQNNDELQELKNGNFPLLIITKSKATKFSFSRELVDQLKMPFKILDFKKKIVSLTAKHEFKSNSLIYLNDYIIDRNERKIKKNSLELQLSEKEVNFLILFSEGSTPISKDLVLKKVWNYSSESETHTVETHIHRLRKKILKKFNDNNFIKNDNRGYYI